MGRPLQEKAGKFPLFSSPVVESHVDRRASGSMDCLVGTRDYAINRNKEKRLVNDGKETEPNCENLQESDRQDPDILEEIEIEEFAVDGICGVY